MTITEIKKTLEDRNLKEVAKRAGVAYSAIRTIMKGGNVADRTLMHLSNYLKGVQK